MYYLGQGEETKSTAKKESSQSHINTSFDLYYFDIVVKIFGYKYVYFLVYSGKRKKKSPK